MISMNSSYTQQESPPAWTQEAYRMPCIEYSFCCPTWVLPPHADLAMGGGTWPGSPLAGYPPWLDLAGYSPNLTWSGGVPDQGTPPPPSRVPPQLDLAGYPPPAGPGRVPPPGVCPMAFWEMLQSIMGYGCPPCGQTDGWKDRRVSKHYLPVVLRTRAVINPVRRNFWRELLLLLIHVYSVGLVFGTLAFTVWHIEFISQIWQI